MSSIAQLVQANLDRDSHQHLHPQSEGAGVAVTGGAGTPGVFGLQLTTHNIFSSSPPVLSNPSDAPTAFIRTFQKTKLDGYLEIWPLRESLFVKFSPGNATSQATPGEWERQDVNGPVCLLPEGECAFVVSCGKVVWPWTNWEEWIKGQFLAIQRCPGSPQGHHKANPFLESQYLNLRIRDPLDERPIKRPGVIIDHAATCPVLMRSHPWLARVVRVYDAVVRKGVLPSGLEGLASPQLLSNEGGDMKQILDHANQIPYTQHHSPSAAEASFERDSSFDFKGDLSPYLASSQGSGDTDDLFNLDGRFSPGDAEWGCTLGSGEDPASWSNASSSSPVTTGISPSDTLLEAPAQPSVDLLMPELSQLALENLQSQVVQAFAVAAILQPNDYERFRQWLAGLVAV